jgi:DNA polymerase-3 subunit delta'
LGCQKVEHGNHADVFWVRPESKLRQIRIRQISRRKDSPPRVLLDAVNLKPTESQYKVAIIVAADRMNEEAANAFLKTLEEPPPRSVLILLTTEPDRLLETILSRCLRLNFAGEGPQQLAPAQMEWLATFSEMAAVGQKSLLGRYRLMDVLLKKLNAVKETIDETLTARSPLEKYEDAEEQLRDKWEQELKAAIEADYRRQRADFLLALQWWLRDVWVQTLTTVQSPKPKVQSREPAGDGLRSGEESGAAELGTINHQLSTIDSPEGLLVFPQMGGTKRVAQRISPKEAMENLRILEQLQRWLSTNVQEALALEVGLLKLHL